ncbi:hypothetical protein [Lewinella sp. IMCC34191]|uniref:hypothetical protein n=1 Tax=Lewinella sp. IMCC34191 TaxID=2259172 RepID=UPI000E22B8E6|nr:hypothetical protein [Lewinella sp. IMCC34191]
MILLLHTLIQGVIGLLFLFYPAVGDLLPGFGDSAGPSFVLLQKLYGLAALFLGGLSLYAYFRQSDDRIFYLVTLSLSIYHYAMIGIQTAYNPDQRFALLHFLLAIFLTGQYLGRRRKSWNTPNS